MEDAQNERTNSRRRRPGRRRLRGRKPVEAVNRDALERSEPSAVQEPPPPVSDTPSDTPIVRPANLAPPTERTEEYCVHHMASFTECEPVQIRSNMTTLRHLRVDHFGEATLYCDCLHDGPHEWPPAMQTLQTAIELDQFLADSTSDA